VCSPHLHIPVSQEDRHPGGHSAGQRADVWLNVFLAGWSGPPAELLDEAIICASKFQPNCSSGAQAVCADACQIATSFRKAVVHRTQSDHRPHPCRRHAACCSFGMASTWGHGVVHASHRVQEQGQSDCGAQVRGSREVVVERLILDAILLVLKTHSACRCSEEFCQRGISIDGPTLAEQLSIHFLERHSSLSPALVRARGVFSCSQQKETGCDDEQSCGIFGMDDADLRTSRSFFEAVVRSRMVVRQMIVGLRCPQTRKQHALSGEGSIAVPFRTASHLLPSFTGCRELVASQCPTELQAWIIVWPLNCHLLVLQIGRPALDRAMTFTGANLPPLQTARRPHVDMPNGILLGREK